MRVTINGNIFDVLGVKINVTEETVEKVEERSNFVAKNINEAGGEINHYSAIQIDCCGYYNRIIEALMIK